MLTRILAPLLLLWMRWRARREAGWGEHLPARRGLVPAVAGQPLWLHAASVGEINSAAELLAEIRARWPDRPLVLTAFTPTGVARWQMLCPQATVTALPIDHPRWVGRAIQRWRPGALLIVETEIWPNLLLSAHAAQVPVLFVSARIQERSAGGWRRWLGEALLQDMLQPVKLIGAQTQADAERFRGLGAGHVEVHGSLKWDAKPRFEAARLSMIKAALGDRPCWLAASTHPGEEEIMLAVHQALLGRWPDLCLILAPRHPRRSNEVAELVSEAGLSLGRRSLEQGPAQVWMVDTLGELTAYMAHSPLVFMAGSLVPIGGHNLLEPAALDCAILTGPHTESCADVVSRLVAAQSLTVVRDGEELEAALSQWLNAPTQAAAQARRAAAVLADGGGALRRSLEALADIEGF